MWLSSAPDARHGITGPMGRGFITLMMVRLRGSGRSGRSLRALAGVLAVALLVAPLLACSLLNKGDDYVPDEAQKLHEEGIEFHPLPVLPDERN